MRRPRRPASLRLRLTLIILVPLLAMAAAIGAWQVADARAKAAEIFDRSLLSTALAVSADVARSDGDAVSLQTQDMLRDTSGGRVFYHVYAPDGVFVTGYATPPVRAGAAPRSGGDLSYFDGRYHGREVRVLTLSDVTTIGGYSGTFTYTVWQDVAVREAFLRDLMLRTFIVIAALTGTVALVVWFGVAFGLRPLTSLEDAISARSSSDLRPIRRRVPAEARGIVARLNSLLGQVERAMRAQTEFVSNAAHQLRNPIAGVMALAEATHGAPTPEATRRRAGELLESARQTRDLANRLLTLERIRSGEGGLSEVDLNEVAAEVAVRLGAASGPVEVAVRPADHPARIAADEVMVREAIVNLADNALRHGGTDLSRIEISVAREPGGLRVEVADDGVGLAAGDVPVALARFGQAVPGEGSGLGLPISEAVAERHGGRLDVEAGGPGLRVSLRFPAGRPAA